MRSRGRAPSTAIIGLLAVVLALLAACTSTEPGTPAPGPPVTIPGWRLTLPEQSDKGTAALLDPAVTTPPYLTRGAQGQLDFWAPVQGSTTANSDHARTELSSNNNFDAGSAPQELRATVTVAQVPPTSKDIIIGQLHGAGDIISVPFVMLHYSDGEIRVVVKQQHSGDEATKLTLLDGVPLGQPFDYTIRDDGNGTLTFTASYNGQHQSVDAPLPAAFQGETVRFQAGAYQLDDSADAKGGQNDGARVTFSTLATSSETAAPLP